MFIGTVYVFKFIKEEIENAIHQSPRSISKDKKKYSKKKYFFNRTEGELMTFLNMNIDHEKYIIYAKPRLIDIFNVLGNDYTAKQKIISKHVDFLICSQKYYIPILGIELDGDSHNAPKRISRDYFFNDVFKQTNLPLLRIKTYELKNKDRLREKIRDYL